MSVSPEVASAIRPYTDYSETTSYKNTVFIIDPQNDFHPGGSLAIPTAFEDADRICNLIDNNTGAIEDMIVSLDTHQRLHIAHSIFWVDSSGKHPDPFTAISVEDVQSGKWKTSNPEHQAWGLAYVQQLAENKRFTLVVWPDHCLLGSQGHAVIPKIHQSLMKWVDTHSRAVEYVLKGNNVLTEHYSAMQADVIRDDDPRTWFNDMVFQRLLKSDRVIICGQALSHCVAFTTRDLVSRWPEDRRKQLVLLTDCASPVPGFEGAAKQFVEDMVAAGIQVTTSDKLEW